MVPVVRLAHEVEVVDLRRIRGGLERRHPGIVDRRRRQAVVHPRVVRRRVVQLGLRERLGRRDVEPVAKRRVDAERHVGVQAVVDDGCHERALARHLRLALDIGRDRQHVVGREVLAFRVREVHPDPLRRELPDLVVYELGRRRLAVEVVRVRKEEALERQLLASEAGDGSRLRGRRGVPAAGDVDLPMRLVLGDLRHRSHPRRHLRAREPLREDDAKLPQLVDRGRRRRSAPGPAAARDSRRDQHGADAYERAAHHSR